MELPFLLFLLLVNFSYAGYGYPDPALVKTIEAAFIKEDNLIELLHAFYPPTGAQPSHVQLSVNNITVQNITGGNNDSAFIWDYDHKSWMYRDDYFLWKYKEDAVIVYDVYVFEEDRSHPNLQVLISSFSPLMGSFDRLSYKLYTALTLQQYYDNECNYSVDIHLSIDSLESMPSRDEFSAAMSVVFSWVSFKSKCFRELATMNPNSLICS